MKQVYVPGARLVAVEVVWPPGVQEYVNGAVPAVIILAVSTPLLARLQVMLVEPVIAAVPPGVLPITATALSVQVLLSVTVTV